MARTGLWLRYGLCTCLGLVLIGLGAAVPSQADPRGPLLSSDAGDMLG